ncbi:LacI family DNA-binding transcriptional regulator [Hoeflea sp.]|uniref:LacI family DNA-binding transcriptional regulator n=1 Tax=Hoeflea sp. TaxID=1940281 RepID=UPI0037493417
MTVSRALKKDSPVSKETREHILNVVRDMNYVPDQMAGSLSTKRSGFVAVLVPSLNNLHFAETVQALTQQLEGIGQQILLGYTDYSAEREERLIETMLRRRPEAIVLSYDGHSDRAMRLLGEANVPVVELWERPEDPVAHTVGFSNFTAAADMTRALIARGYRNIAFLGEDEDDWTRGAARRKGFLHAMEQSGLSAHRLLRFGRPPLSIEDGAAALPALLAQFPDTDCIFCVSDVPAFGVLSALKSLGRVVPDEIGIVGFGNFEVSRFATPAISTVTVDPKTIGDMTGRLIADLLADRAAGAAQVRHINVDVTLTFRDSTRSF